MVRRPPPKWTDPPERVWIYKDVYEVLRVSVDGPHRARQSHVYVRAVLVEQAVDEVLDEALRSVKHDNG